MCAACMSIIELDVVRHLSVSVMHVCQVLLYCSKVSVHEIVYKPCVSGSRVTGGERKTVVRKYCGVRVEHVPVQDRGDLDISECGVIFISRFRGAPSMAKSRVEFKPRYDMWGQSREETRVLNCDRAQWL
jgi:hypothetical protein